MEILPLVQLENVSSELCCRQASGNQLGRWDLTDYEEREGVASRMFHIFLDWNVQQKQNFILNSKAYLMCRIKKAKRSNANS